MSIISRFTDFNNKINGDGDIIHGLECTTVFIVHYELLVKLQTLGISGNLLSWICAFLSDRSQCVVIENFSSSWVSVQSGVPQGSVLVYQ